jgi:hypothetical protein
MESNLKKAERLRARKRSSLPFLAVTLIATTSGTIVFYRWRKYDNSRKSFRLSTAPDVYVNLLSIIQDD